MQGGFVKQLDDKSTLDLFEATKPRGRPITGKAKSNAQRMREYRQRKKENGHFNQVELETQVRMLEIQLRHAHKEIADLYRQQNKGDL